MSRLMSIRNLINGLDYITIHGNIDGTISGISYDSRMIKHGMAFIAVSGFNSDGHHYIDSVINAGAALIICEKLPLKLDPRTCYINVENSKTAMAILAGNYYDHADQNLIKIAVTGTNGKSSTVFFIQEILTHLDKKTGLIGTIHYDVGSDKKLTASHTTPESLKVFELFHEMVENKCEFCAMEVSSHALSLDRINGIRFEAAIFTNLSHDHLDFHKDLDDYFEAKNLLFKNHLNGYAIVNIDDKYSGKISSRKVFTYGQSIDADFQILNITLKLNETEFTLKYKGQKYDCKTSVLSRFNVWNIVSAIGALVTLGFDVKDVIKTANKLRSVPGRMEKINVSEITAIVDYAHSPDALSKLLETTKELCLGKLILVFGCGGDRDKEKRPVMGSIADNLADMIIVSSDNPRTENPNSIIDEVKKGIKRKENLYHIENRKEAIEKALSLASKEDVVVIAGKGHEDYQEINGQRYQFDDREVIRNWNA